MAAIVLKEKRYEAIEAFEATLDLPGEDFVSLGEQDGLEPEQRVSRQYIVAEDGHVVIDGFVSTLKPKTVIKDHYFARQAMRQGAPVNVRLKFRFDAGQTIPEHLGAPLADAGHPKVAVAEFLPGLDSEQEPDAPADTDPPAAPAKGASKAPAKGKE